MECALISEPTELDSDRRHGASPLATLLAEIRACRICRDAPRGLPLPHQPRPVVRASATARICVASQAPGTRVHASGLPFTDRSGDRLRQWMGVTADEFYDTCRIAIVPMGFCFPGHDPNGGDLPPRPECATLWHRQLFALLPRVELLLLIGSYAQRWHLGAAASQNLTDTVSRWQQLRDVVPGWSIIVLPHPSWRNNGWIKRNPWFEIDLLPQLRTEVRQRL